MTDTAISAGVWAPMSMPMGARILCNLGIGDAGFLQALDALGVVARRAECADIEAVGLECQLQGLVVDVADMGQRYHGRIGVEADLGQDVLRPFGVDGDSRKPLGRGEGRARIDHLHLVAGEPGDLGQHLTDVAGADDDDAGGRHQRMQEDLAVGPVLQLALGGGEAGRHVVGNAGVVAREHGLGAIGQPRLDDEALALLLRGHGLGHQLGAATFRLDPLDVDLDLSAARQAGAPSRLVGDAELQQLRLAALDDLLGLDDDIAFDAAARHRALEPAVPGDGHLAAGRHGRRAPRVDDGGDGDGAVAGQPVGGSFQDAMAVAGGDGGGHIGHGAGSGAGNAFGPQSTAWLRRSANHQLSRAASPRLAVLAFPQLAACGVSS